MHYVFDTPTDKFVFDVSHQAYIHKLLTGRRDRFDTIRQPGGLNGFMLRTESEHDCLRRRACGHGAVGGAGHGRGARYARRRKSTWSLLAGDAAFTNGISFEALNNIADADQADDRGAQRQRVVDRHATSARSREYLHKIVTNEHTSHLHDRAARLLERVGGKTAVHMARKAEEAAKGMLWPSA